MTDHIYDTDNIFAKILRGEIPSTKIYEDNKTFALMDIMPRCDGHCLVLPKAPARNIFDIDPADLASVMETTQLLSRAVMKAMNADGITIKQSNELAGDQVVFHLHVHIVPRYNGVRMPPYTGKMEEPDVLEANAAKIRAAL